MKVELTNFPEVDESSTTILPAEKGTRVDSTSTVMDEGCIGEDEEEKDSSGSGEAKVLG